MQTRLQTARRAYEHAFQRRAEVIEQGRRGNKASLEERCTVLYEWNRAREEYAKLFHGRTYPILLSKKQALTRELVQENDRLHTLHPIYLPLSSITYSLSQSPSSSPSSSSQSPSSAPSSSSLSQSPSAPSSSSLSQSPSSSSSSQSQSPSLSPSSSPSLSPSSSPSSAPSSPSSSRNDGSDKKGMELFIQLDELDKQLYVFE